ncbi:hypothetical protein Tco_1049566, partial [Tanacetum coccineum]
FDKSTDDYKVVAITECNKVNICSLKNGTWKNIGSINSFASCMVMLVTAGSTSVWFCLVLHRILSGWLCLLESASVWCLNPAALSFGLHRIKTSSSIESALWDAPLCFCLFYVWQTPTVHRCGILKVFLLFSTMNLQRRLMVKSFNLCDEGDKHLGLGVLEKWLCVLCNYDGCRVDVWVMKVYGLKDSWTKLVSIPYPNDCVWLPFVVPLCISNDGKVLLRFGSKLVVYDIHNSSLTQLSHNFYPLSNQMCIVVESLVSPCLPMMHADILRSLCR